MSSLIRSQIGICRRRLKKALEDADDIDDVQEVENSTEEEVYDDIAEIADLGYRIKNETVRIQDLLAEWKQLINQDPAEKDIFDDYKQRVGDFEKDIKNGSESLSQLKQKYQSFVQIHQKKSPATLEYPAFGGEIDVSKIQAKSPVKKVTAPAPKQQEVQEIHTEPIIIRVPQATANYNPPVINYQTNPMPIQVNNPNSIPVQLPPITMPTFNGDYVKYNSFIELFSSIIDPQPIHLVAKMAYLKAALEGPAKNLIEHLELSGDNYHHARQLLHANYGDTIRTRHHLLRQLQNLPSMAHTKNPAQLQDFWTKTSTIFHQLKNLQPESDNTTTADIICKRLPQRYIEKLYSGANAHRTLLASELLEILREYIHSDSLIITIANDIAATDKNTTTMSVQQSSAHHGGNKMSKFHNSPKMSTPCAFCSSTSNFHRHEDCPVYKTAEERKKQAQNLKVCFKCLKTGHRSNQCQRSRPCFHCKGSHHSAMCAFRNRLSMGPNRQQNTQITFNRPQQQQQSNGGTYGGYRGQSPGRVNYSGQDARNQKFDQRRVQFGNTSVATSEDVSFGQPMDENDEISVTFKTSSEPTRNSDNGGTTCQIASQISESTPIAMMTTQLLAEDGEGSEFLSACAFFDNGSDRSYITEKFAQQLKLKSIGTKRLKIATFADTTAKMITAKQYLVKLKIKGDIIPITLTEVPVIAKSLVTAEIDESTIKNLLTDSDAVLPRSTGEPGILIGLDSMAQVLGDTRSKILPNGMTIHWTRCGIIVTGKEKTPRQVFDETSSFANDDQRYHSTTNSSISTVGILHTNPEDQHAELRALVERLWSLEAARIYENPRTSDEELTAHFFDETTTREPGGRYVCRWPFKEDTSVLPDNRYLAYHRLQSTCRRLMKDEEMYKNYNSIIEDQLSRGFIEKVTDESSRKNVHYLSHHPIIKLSSSSTKMRIVFDASARATKSSKSFNDILYTGESLLPKMNGLMMRIRKPEILISCDIEKAFLMLSLHPDDRDYCRFLWQPPGSDRPICYRFLRVPFGVKSSPFLLNSTMNKHLTSSKSKMAKEMLRGTYVDNIFYGVPTVENGLEFYEECKKIFAEAEMNVTQFFSNSSELNESFASKEGSKAETLINQKVLGLSWNTQNDSISISIPTPLNGSFTKRKILQLIASIYDPLGILGPVILKCKLFFQKLWARSADWDEPLTEDECREWNSIQTGLLGDQISINRKYFTTPTTSDHVMELHVFGDASDAAYGSVAYLRRIGENSIESTFVTSSSRVSPLRKALTIPQAELLAIEQCARLSSIIQKEIDWPISKIVIWSDSLCSLDQVASNKAGTAYGRNRLREINRLVPNAIFSHVPGKINPADVLSRGCSLEELRNHELWWSGPQFLQQPTLPIRTSTIQAAVTSVCLSNQPETADEILNLDPNRFSSFTRLFNVVVLLLHVFNKDKLTSKDRAKRVIIKLAQQLNPPEEQTIRNLGLQMENGIWYFIGRIPDRKVPYLPAHKIAKLLTYAIHLRQKHISPVQTLAKLRNEAWIPKGLSFVQKVIRECPVCRKLKCRAVYQPDFPSLPLSRTEWYQPFTFCGMDYAGPIKALNNGETRKYWFILFTCFTSRYTVVELTTSLDAENLLRILMKFCAQYGTPKEIRTDNAAQITMLAAVTREAQHQMSSMSLSIVLPIFRFIAALSPWSGGIYERMVALVKKILVRAGATRRLMEEEDLRTLLKEAESIINERPLTYINNEDLQPLRPVDFLFPNKRSTQLLQVDESLDTTSLKTSQATLLENWMKTSSLVDYFTRRWKEEYPQLLQSRNQTVHQQDRLAQKSELKVGDVVMFESDTHKQSWPLARVKEVGPRSAKLLHGQTKQIIERPYKKIYQLEAAPEETDSPTNKDDLVETIAPTTPQTTGNPSTSADKALPRRSPRLMSTALLTLVAASLMVPTTEAIPVHNSSSNLVDNNFSGQMNQINQVLDKVARIMLIICGILLVSSMLNVLISFIQCFSLIVKGIRSIMKTLFGLIRCAINSICSPCQTRSNKIVITMVTVVLFLHLQPVNCCNDVAHISANEKACFSHDNASHCHVNNVSIVTVKANGSSSCLVIGDDEEKSELTLKIVAESLVSYCQKRTVFYSRDFKLTHEYIKRCISAGSCSIAKCASITPDEDLTELSQEAKNHPGFTRCDPGCGGWHCSCFYYDPACLFYRYYALPTSNNIYEVYQCPTWLPRLRITIELGELKISTELSPGTKYTLPNSNVSITAVGLTAPPLQAHTATYIASYGLASKVPHWTAYSFTPPSAPGTPAKGFVGEFQCSTRQDAENFRCVFDRSLCKCEGFATEVNCQCKNQKMDDFRKKNKLPVKGINHKIITINNQVATISVQETIVSMHVEMRNASIARMTTVQECAARQEGEIEGCHSCFQGGKVAVLCTSKKPTKAFVHCGTLETTLDCGPFGIINSMPIASDVSDISYNCTVDCGRRTTLSLEGTLMEQSTFETNSTSYSSPYEKIVQGSMWLGNFIGDVLNVFFSSLMYPVYLICIVFAVYILFRLFRCYLSRRISLSKRQLKLLNRSKFM